MSETKKPETREEDSWFSKAQFARLAPADHADPDPTASGLQGEFPQSAEDNLAVRAARAIDEPARAFHKNIQ